MVLVLAVGTTRAACAYCLLLLFATLLVATVYCLLLLLAIHIPERLAAACYLLRVFLTKDKTCQENGTFSPGSRCNVRVFHES